MRYMLETPWGRFSDDGSHFEFDYQKVANQTGYSVDELHALGVIHCYHHPRQDMSLHPSEASAVLVAAATRRAA
jgi:hypothetical protein